MSEYIIETHNLTKRYGNQVSVSNLNIHVKQGRIYGLLGRNGAGKTTTMRMLLGLTAPTSGEVKIFGRPMQGNENKILPRIGCLIESPGFYPNLTATENLRIFAELRGINKPNYIKDALELVNLPYRDKKLFSEYSLGMKQRLAIALAVMHEPEVLILDEPINGLDPIGIAEVRSFIRELCDARGKTILISSHILSEISLLADDIGIIDRGVLLEEESLKELEAKDNGNGIHPEDLHHIFKRFYRSRFSKDKQGIGLGLPLAKMIIEAHRGTIEVESELGIGTTFTLNFLNPTKL